tara:strand:- start:62 stop:190 length:129 start_codon:yes stop_codon:yes gene_type:complete
MNEISKLDLILKKIDKLEKKINKLWNEIFLNKNNYKKENDSD